MSLPETLTQARQQASPDPARPLSFRYIRDQVKPLLLEHTPTEETLRALHSPTKCPKKPDPLVVWALAEFYGLDMDDLDADAAEALDNVFEISEARRRHPRVERSNPGKGARVGARSENTPKGSDLREGMNPGKYVMARRVA